MNFGQTKMDKMSKNIEFLNFCATIINNPYDGNPSNLNAFVSSMHLIQQCSEPSQRELIIRFIRTRLIDRAAEVVPENCTTIADIITALKTNIKRDSSDLILGKMFNLYIEKACDFLALAEKLEDLSEKLIEALIGEGVPRSKAIEATVGHTVKICKANTPYSKAKKMLKRRTFLTPKEVIAMTLLETSKRYSSAYFEKV